MTDSQSPKPEAAEVLGEMGFSQMVPPDPLTAYKYALDGWGKLLAPLAKAGRDKVDPRDRRFSAPEWEQPVFDLMRQGYKVMSDYMLGAAEALEDVDPAQKARLGFAIRTMVEAMSPAIFCYL